MDEENEKIDDYKSSPKEKQLLAYIMSHIDKWREYRDDNYLKLWEEYERIWRGIWAGSDKQRDSERSQVVTPVTRQAIESHQAELEEAIFGRKDWFDIEDDVNDKNKADIAQLKANLTEDFKKDKIKKNISQIIQLGSVYGSGIGELILKESTQLSPAKEPIKGMNLSAVGVKETDKFSVLLHPVSPKNFIIDPTVTDIEDALGCAVEEFVGLHTIKMGMASGKYRECDVGTAGPDPDLEPVQNTKDFDTNRVKILKWYGLVPRDLLTDDEVKEDSKEDEEETESYDVDYDDLVEAIVVIANDAHILKKTESEYMMQDRPLVIYRPEIIAGRFFGCGIVEKGYNMQKAIDGQVRMHLDASALATAPMMGMDATRMPRGFKFEIRPGKTVLTNGDPRESLFPFNFGQVNPVSVETAQLFERYLQQATGTLDSAGLPQQVGNQADAGGMAMAMSGIIKKNKRALINFQDDFLIPFINKAAWRYMQYQPDRYPAGDYTFIAMSTLGIMAREYEQQQFIGLLQTLGPQSPIVPLITKSIVENSSLSNREFLAKAIEESSKPNPTIEKANQEQAAAQLRVVNAEASKKEAEAAKAAAEAEATPIEAKAKIISALSNNLNEDNEGADFERRARMMEIDQKGQELQIKAADTLLKDKDIDSNFEIAKMQMQAKKKDD